MDPSNGLAEDQYPLTYLELEDDKTLIYAHITLMLIAWAILLPAGESKRGLHLPAIR